MRSIEMGMGTKRNSPIKRLIHEFTSNFIIYFSQLIHNKSLTDKVKDNWDKFLSDAIISCTSDNTRNQTDPAEITCHIIKQNSVLLLYVFLFISLFFVQVKLIILRICIFFGFNCILDCSKLNDKFYIFKTFI